MVCGTDLEGYIAGVAMRALLQVSCKLDVDVLRAGLEVPQDAVPEDPPGDIRAETDSTAINPRRAESGSRRRAAVGPGRLVRRRPARIVTKERSLLGALGVTAVAAVLGPTMAGCRDRCEQPT